MKIIHGWPDAPAAQDELIRRLKEQGFGGVVCNVSFDQYLESEAHWRAFVRAVRAAREAGLTLWLYDERGYPSGNAGGLVLREHPEWEARGLLIADAQSRGGAVELDAPPGQLLVAAAFPVRDGQMDLSRPTDVSAFLSAGKLRWHAPPGAWRVMLITEHRLYEGTHAEANLWQKMPYVNLLLPEPTKRFLELTHDRYAAHLGHDLGKFFVATFTDEPSLMSWFFRPMPYRPLPWASNLPGEFKRRRGYALDPARLPALAADAGPQGEKLRHDFWLTVGELVAENYFGQIQERCRQYRVPSGGHLLAEELLTAHVALYGDFFRCARRMDAPGIDCLTSLPPEVPWYIARLLASVAELERRDIVMSETSDHNQVWRAAGDARPKRVVTEAEIRGTLNRLFVSGVNTITSYYSFTGLDAAALRRLNEWVGRCAALLTGGHQVADIAVLYPIESLWTKFTPARHWGKDSPGALLLENTWRNALEDLFAAQRDFTIVDSRALRDAKVQTGALVHGELRWRVVVLPAADTLPLAAWKQLAQFVDGGGALILLGARPRNSEREFPSPQVQRIARRWLRGQADRPRLFTGKSGGAVVFLPNGYEGLLGPVLDRLLERDAQVVPADSPVRVTHRRVDGREVFFLINDSPEPWRGEVEFCASGPGERWDLATGTRAETIPGPRVRLSLEPYGATAVGFPAAREPRRFKLAPDSLPALTSRPIASVSPRTLRGEFVRADVGPDEVRSRPEQPVWRARAELTRSDVDTFLFLGFELPEALDLREAHHLVFDTWVPPGQQTANEILVILREEGGGDFLASTGRLLGAAGHQRVFVPLNRFQHAGWSQDADARLDRSRVREIRVGWGGYTGTAGERVEFSVALPQTGWIAKSSQ
ncbi:MAG: glycosyl hydrolase [Verrucomicrobiae bacterium]|nr:glycosyl hydrolase [Verrucomicrobiae bacterium]